MISNTGRGLSKFEVSLATTERHKAELYCRILESMSIPYGFSRGHLRDEQKENTEMELVTPRKISLHIFDKQALQEKLKRPHKSLHKYTVGSRR